MENHQPDQTNQTSNPNIISSSPTPSAPPAIPNPFSTPAPQNAPIPQKKSSTPLIIGLSVGAAALLGIVAVVLYLIFGRQVDYTATYDSLKPLETSMDDINYGDCYDIHQDIDASYISVSEYNQYITSCLAEFAAVETATNEFAKSSGAKHDQDIKSAFESFQSAFKALYSKKSDLESQLALYATYHEFYLTIEDADHDSKNLEQAIISASSLFENTKNSELKTFAQGFRERGLAYVRAIDNYQNSSSYSSALYTEVRTKMNDFTDYIEQNAPDIAAVSGLDFTKMNDLNQAYDQLSNAVRNAYYDHI